MTITQQTSSRPDFRERAKANDVPVARLIGFEAERIGEGRAAVVLAAGPQHANPMGTLHGGIFCDIADAAMGWPLQALWGRTNRSPQFELKTNFFRPVWQAQLRAEGVVVKRGEASVTSNPA